MKWLVARPYRTVLVSLMLIGELLCIGVQGTFASYTTASTNQSASQKTGTVTLSTTTASTACQSWTASSDNNLNASCTAATLSAAGLWPGVAQTQKFTVDNTGSLAASKLDIYGTGSSGCTNSTLCGEALFYVETTNSTGGSPACVWPTVSTSACAFTTGDTITQFETAYRNQTNALAVTGGIGANTSDYFQFGMELPTAATNTYQDLSATFPIDWFIQQ
jgi:hypothetical protein